MSSQVQTDHVHSAGAKTYKKLVRTRCYVCLAQWEPSAPWHDLSYIKTPSISPIP